MGPIQTEAVSDQGLHCLHTGISIQNKIKILMKSIHQTSLHYMTNVPIQFISIKIGFSKVTSLIIYAINNQLHPAININMLPKRAKYKVLHIKPADLDTR